MSHGDSLFHTHIHRSTWDRDLDATPVGLLWAEWIKPTKLQRLYQPLIDNSWQRGFYVIIIA